MSKLYIVPTPIGNLQDITYRSVDVLSHSDFILAEDTRVSKKLLSHYNIQKPMISFHKYNEHKILDLQIEKLKSGEVVSLICDAGTPSISDPGFLLVRECIKHDIDVECLPGATAFVPAIVNSGMPTDRFVFEGFLPIKKGRKKRLELLSEENRTMIFYESRHRMLKTLSDFSYIFGIERRVSVSREISKVFEETVRGSINEVKEYFENHSIKGEFVLIVEGKK